MNRQKLYDLFEKHGRITVAVNDVFLYKRRNELNLMVQEGICNIFFSTPSYHTYTLKITK